MGMNIHRRRELQEWIYACLDQLRADLSRFYGISKCKVNLNLVHLLRSGKITPAEFEKLKTFSKVGFAFHLLNILIGFIIIDVFSLAPGTRYFSPDVDGPGLFLAKIAIIVGVLYSLMDYRGLVLLSGFLIFSGLLFGLGALL